MEGQDIIDVENEVREAGDNSAPPAAEHPADT
ncbi:unnamed protein product, partial [Gongylonema pulchrum]|uniref:Nucleotide exchange factor GrpE n=1 Tax=Gongylonema pulchrum TaxID=637853 RepID=A0A183EUK4_9BILA